MQALVSRRRALKGAACTAALGAVPFSTLRTAVAKAMDDQETVTWSACTVNCGSRCPVRVVTKNKQVIRIETDNMGVPRPVISVTISLRCVPVCAVVPLSSASIPKIACFIR